MTEMERNISNSQYNSSPKGRRYAKESLRPKRSYAQALRLLYETLCEYSVQVPNPKLNCCRLVEVHFA